MNRHLRSALLSGVVVGTVYLVTSKQDIVLEVMKIVVPAIAVYFACWVLVGETRRAARPFKKMSREEAQIFFEDGEPMPTSIMAATDLSDDP